MVEDVDAQLAVARKTGFIALLALMHTISDGGVP